MQKLNQFNVSTVVYDRRSEWNCLHQKTQNFLTPSGKGISEGKTKRLLAYAIKQMEVAGFPCFENVEISTTKDGYYHVTFRNNKGGKISVQGILLNRGGHPFLDHGFHIEYTNP